MGVTVSRPVKPFVNRAIAAGLNVFRFAFWVGLYASDSDIPQH
jgi:hypothetical protein